MTDNTKPRQPDGKLTTQTGNQTIVMLVYFNHNSKENFEDKLFRVIKAEQTA